VTTSPAATSTPKGRKGSAAGGGKAWTEEEEVYLLQMRLQKVAYKKIAAHLNKTELACRLHYHQLSHGGNRRKRTNSLSSNSSDKSATSPARTPLESSRARSRTPSRLSPISHTGAIQRPSSSSNSKIKGKPLLPKLADSSTPARKQSPGKSKQLRCDTGSIDRERLQKIIEEQKKVFWEYVATQYGAYTGDYLEQYWNNGLKSGPPTPAISPQSKANSPTPSCSSEEVETPGSMKSENISELSTPQPLRASEPLTPAASAEPAQADTDSDDKMVVETSAEEPQTKTEVVEQTLDVTMNDIPEAGDSEHTWSE